jgi:hypothetical protein
MNNYTAPYDNQANQVREVTTVQLWDDYAVAPATALTEGQLFVTSTKPKEYQNFTLPSTLDRLLVITHIMAIHNFQFTVADAALNLWEQQRFENDSMIRFQIQDKLYPDIPLAFALQYTLGLEGTALTKTNKLNQMFQLKDPIKIPPAGTAEFKFIPARSLTTAAAGATNPILPGRSFTNDRAFRVKVVLYGYLDRPAS